MAERTHSTIDLDRVFVVGLGIMGEAVARACLARGVSVSVAEDRPVATHFELAEELDFELLATPDQAALEAAIGQATAVLPSPGIPETHPLFVLAGQIGRPIISEFDLADRWDDRPVAAITGTNGKTTVTMMVTEMLRASGLRAEPVGNTETPLVAALDDAETDVFVVEASSFRLGHSRSFRPRIATWLNFAPDHLDVHASLEVYEQAKARIWADQGPDDIALANADDPVVAAHSVHVRARLLTFGCVESADYHSDGTTLRHHGEDLLVVAELQRSLPHDQSNALAAAATAMGVGATVDGVRQVLRSFEGLAHRVEFVAELDGVAFYNDSKATAPHATAAAVAGFESVVLIAGGKNKGLDLRALAADVDRVRAVVAIGDSADEVDRAFAGKRPVTKAQTMADAVATAAGIAHPGEVVLLSPGCASFDWYSSYGERGDDFKRLVHELVARGLTK